MQITDFRTGLSSAGRCSLGRILRIDWMPVTCMMVLELCYSAAQECVLAYGVPPSPALLNFATDWIMHRGLDKFWGVQLGSLEDSTAVKLILNRLVCKAKIIVPKVNASQDPTSYPCQWRNFVTSNTSSIVYQTAKLETRRNLAQNVQAEHS